MATFQNPTPLNPLQRFRQAGRILRETSLASNPAWYRTALEMDFQVHVRTDGGKIYTLIRDRNAGEWMNGPAFEEAFLTDETRAREFAGQLIEHARSAGVQGAGVIVHYAEDFSTAELKSYTDLSKLRDEIETDPKSAIADNSGSVEDTSWRVFPYPGHEHRATAIGIGKRWLPFLQVLRTVSAERNFPVVTQTFSTPLIDLLSLAEYKKDAVAKPIVAILPFARFTVVAFLDSSGELLLLRSVQHRGGGGPVNLRQILAATAASLELTDPEVHFLPTDPLAEKRVLEELGMGPRFGVETNFPGVFRHSSPFRAAGAVEVPLEFRIVVSLEVAAGTPIGENRTFSSLGAEGWVSQDFLPRDREMREIYPTRAEMRLIRASKILRMCLLVIGIAIIAFFSTEVISMVGQEQWSYKEQDGMNLKQRQVILNQQKARIEFWDTMLVDRSRVWSAMEVLPRLAPDPKNILIKSFNYSAVPNSAGGQAKMGFVKEWKITGYTRGHEVEKMSRDRVAEIFNQIAKDTGAESFNTAPPTRSLLVNVKTQENTQFVATPSVRTVVAPETSFPFTFELTITQRFENTDPMAFLPTKAP